MMSGEIDGRTTGWRWGLGGREENGWYMLMHDVNV